MQKEYESRLSEQTTSKRIEAQERIVAVKRKEQKEKKEIEDQLQEMTVTKDYWQKMSQTIILA